MRRAATLLGVCFFFIHECALGQEQHGDSARALAAAHGAQARFERVRRHFSPLSAEDQPPCDVKIGRMCYWNDSGTETPPREPRSIARARLELIAALDTLSRRAPKNDWINGERVRYMIQAGQDSAAVAAARGCAPARWRCRVVLAYAFHASQRFGDAAAEFDSALAEMSSAERCRWNDISLLLDDDESAPYNRIPCGQRDSVERHFWELAQPSFAVAGNDRRTEHFSRVLLADLSAAGENPYGLGWASDLREILIRYGEPLWYTIPWEVFVAEPPTPTGHDRNRSFHFAPDLSNGAAHWDLYAHTARERYAPAYMDTITNLAVQFAMVKRGDSALVVAVYGDGMDGTAVLGIGGAGTDSGATERTLNHVRRARAPWKAELVAMEVLDTQSRVDARAREWLRPPSHAEGAPELSTLLLFGPDSTSDVRSLNDALACALSSNELRDRRRLGLYWESYRDPRDSSDSGEQNGARPDSVITRNSDSTTSAPADTTAASVSVIRIDGGVLRWLASALHVKSRDSPLVVRWHDSSPSAAVVSHSLVLDLSQLPLGTYRIVLDDGPDAVHRTEISREIRLR